MLPSLEPEQQRIDKWIWHARFTRTRTLAQKLIIAGNVRVNKIKIKRPSFQIKPSDVLTIAKNHQVSVIEIQTISLRRGSPDDAQKMYTKLTEKTETSNLSQITTKAQSEQRMRVPRPNKHDRRKLRELKTKNFDSWG